MSDEGPHADETWLRGDWLQTYSGKRFYPLSPRVQDIDPVDIAHALSLLCRYGGHIDRFYSVAEHCVLMSEWIEKTALLDYTGGIEGGTPAEVRDLALWALLHDATEAYVIDVPRPLKRELTGYSVIENRVMSAIMHRFDLPCGDPAPHRVHDFRCGGMMPSAVKRADNRILLDETAVLMPRRERWVVDDLEPLGVDVQGWSSREAEFRYLNRLCELVPDLAESIIEQRWAPRWVTGLPDGTPPEHIREVLLASPIFQAGQRASVKKALGLE